MISLRMDMVQYDCPYIETSIEHDVSFYAKQWNFDTAQSQLETRIEVAGADGPTLDNALDTLDEHSQCHGFDLLKRNGDRAVLRSRIAQTDAMRVVREYDGKITGPFDIDDGSEIWHLGFELPETANGALSDLERDNEFTVVARDRIDLEDYHTLLHNTDIATSIVSGCRELSEVERRTLETAVSNGYFETPRDATLSTLAEQLDVSKTAVSKNLRRGERKLLGRVVNSLDVVDVGRENRE